MTAPVDPRQVAFAGVAGQAELLRSGTLTSVDLVDLLLTRIDALQPRLNAFRLVLAGEARQAAAAADDARRDGDTRPLLGVPVAVKDNVAVAGHCAMTGTASPEPPADSDDELVRRLRAAGLILLGLTHLPELALWAATESRHHGITRNPWDTARAPGGSSGGSSAAVAAGLVAAAHATDGLGSIRIPASSCGLVGLKPTHGLVPLGPDPDHWNGLSHAGFVTRSVLDTALLLDAVVQPGREFASLESPSALRIAVSMKPLTPVRIDAAVRAGVDQTIKTLRELGHTVIVRDPPYGRRLANANSIRYLAGVRTDVGHLADRSATEGRTRSLAHLAGLLPPRVVSGARRQGALFAERMSAFFADVDVLLTPTMPVLPVAAGSIVGKSLLPTLRTMVPRALFTGQWNGCGLPAVSLPVATTEQGFPIGMQLVGPADSERMLLGLGAQLEEAVGWLDRTPPLE